ncbi:MAG: sugar transferase [Muribaculaceae bacterium]|nr:sugar transferase [Muribaculaceae bacterium]
MIQQRLQRIKYVIGDFVSSSLAWLCYNCVRYAMGAVHGSYSSLGEFLGAKIVLLGQVFFPLMMMLTYVLSGYYNEVMRKSRVQELFTTFWSAVVNALAIFFLALINDVILPRRFNYEMILILWSMLFFMVYAVRAVITNITSRNVKSRRWSSATLIVGADSKAVAFVNRVNAMKQSLGYRVIGFVPIPGEQVKASGLPCYAIDDLKRVCASQKVEELIVVPTSCSGEGLLHTINRLFELRLPIRVTPDRENVLLSLVRVGNLHGELLVDISGCNLSDCEKNIKRLIDIVTSAVALVLLLPVYLAVAVAIKLDSRGAVLYRQERVGRHNVPFRIIKFRSMVSNAEQTGTPQLTRDDDPRVTRVGRFMRKYRIDELPQFWNVLVGDMSIVGPRPERQFYARQIQQRVPSYALLHQVRPGITSLGMVKFGYAQNVDEMVERLNYDLVYLENMSLLNDLKIMIYTVKIVFTGRGM